MPSPSRHRVRRHRRHRDPQRPGPSRLDPADQTALLAHAGESLTSDRRRSVRVELPSGAQRRCTATRWARARGGRVPWSTSGWTRNPCASTAPRPRRPRMPLPGLVGSDPVWLRACRQVEAASRSGEWLVVSGEPGVGKLALVQAVQLRRNRSGPFEVLDAADAGSTPGWFRSLRDALAASLTPASSSGTSTPSTRSGSASSSPPWAVPVGPRTAARPGSRSPWAG